MAPTEASRTLRDPTSVPLWLDGKEHFTNALIPVISPGVSLPVWSACCADTPLALSAVEAASKALKTWRNSKPAFRRDILYRAGQIFDARVGELVAIEMAETGATELFAQHVDVQSAAEMLKDIAGRLVTVVGGAAPICGRENMSAMVLKEPIGVVLGIAPWNAPFVLGVRACATALAAGCTVVLKAAELSPRCYWAIGSIFAEAGLPAGCLNIITVCRTDAQEVTDALIEHPAIRKVSFTGSTAVGRIIAAKAGKQLKPCLLELGGKASAIVLQDADIGNAVAQCASGAFVNSGQICMSTERILVHSNIATEFMTALESNVATCPTSPSPLINSTSFEKSKALLRDAVAKGATTFKRIPLKEQTREKVDASLTSMTIMEPTVVSGVTKDMAIWHEESFGPSVSVMVFQTDDEAIALANDTPYGLSAAIFTADLARGLHLARRIESGAVHINSMTVHDDPNLSHGGVKASGFGRFNAEHGIAEFLTCKTITWIDEVA